MVAARWLLLFAFFFFSSAEAPPWNELAKPREEQSRVRVREQSWRAREAGESEECVEL